MATGWKGVFIFYLLKKFFFTCARCRVTCRDMKVTHELSYVVVRGNLEPEKRRRARGRNMDVLSGFPVGYPSWGDADSLPGSRGAEEQAEGLAERAEASRIEQSCKKNAEDGPRLREIFCFVLYFIISI